MYKESTQSSRAGKATWRGCLISVMLVMLCGLLAPVAAAAAQWSPDPAIYGYTEVKNVAVRMDDGITLRANVFYPADPKTGAKAAGNFPVLLQQSPYGKDRWGKSYEKAAAYYVPRGYIMVVADMRGYGQSQGQASWFGKRMGKDGVELANWAAHLDHSSGKVGLMGCSYLGVVQFFTANNLPKNSPVKALAPMCADSNFYRDLTAFGGIPSQFVMVDRALTVPGIEDDPATDPFMQTIISQGTGGDLAYYGPYWEALNVTTFMPKIISLGIPILTETGWRDLFPGGNIDAYVAAQNAYYHRPLTQPIKPGDAVTGRYQAIVGNWTHGEHVNGALRPILLKWYDTWLKGKDTGMADTKRPLHLYEMGANRWVDTASYPLSSSATTLYLSRSTLSPAPRKCTSGDAGTCTDTLYWVPEGSVRSGGSLAYETSPLTAPLVLAGPGNVTIHLKSTRPEVEVAATLYEIAADGTVTKLTNGIQLGSQRALDRSTSWYSDTGKLVRPSHYFTKAKASAVPVGRDISLDIELLPSFVRVAPGSRLRLVLVSQPATGFRQYGGNNGPKVQMRNAVTPTPQQLTNLVGGIYTISYSSDAPSLITLSTAQDSQLTPSSSSWGPGS